jgi:HSP20 family protein
VELTVAAGCCTSRPNAARRKSGRRRATCAGRCVTGPFPRSLPLPEGVTEADITASCKDGVLEIRIPEPKHEEAKKIAISKS